MKLRPMNTHSENATPNGFGEGPEVELALADGKGYSMIAHNEVLEAYKQGPPIIKVLGVIGVTSRGIEFEGVLFIESQLLRKWEA